MVIIFEDVTVISIVVNLKVVVKKRVFCYSNRSQLSRRCGFFFLSLQIYLKPLIWYRFKAASHSKIDFPKKMT